MTRSGVVDLYPALQQCVDALDDAPREWDPWADVLRECATSPGYSRWGVDRVSFLVEGGRYRIYRQKVRDAWNAHASTQRDGRLRIDFNPAQACSGGIHPCPVGDLSEVVRDVADRVGRALPIGRFSAAELEQAQVTRVDLARDFEGVAHRPAILEGVFRLPRPRRLRVEAYKNDRLVTRPNGLVLGTDEEATLYDRHELYRSLDDDRLKPRLQWGVPKGVVRFEARARKGWLRRAQMVTIADVTERRCLDLLRDRWVWSQFGTPVTDRSEYIVAIQRAGWTLHEQAAHHWIETAAAAGYPVRLNSRQKRRHRERLQQLGAFVELNSVKQVRLDFAAGTEACDV